MTVGVHDADRTRDALAAAHLYYMQDLTMETIARELGTSRSTVSRLLSWARATGLVDIQIRDPHASIERIENVIADRHQVVAHVVPVPGHASDVDRQQRVAVFAARRLSQFVDSNTIMGIAWGATLTAVSRHLVPKQTHNSQIVQLNGAGNLGTTGVEYASEILGRFGAAFGAHVEQFPVPAFFDDPSTKKALWRERGVQRLLELQARCDLALFGLGSPQSEVPGHVYTGGYLDQADQDELARCHVVGDVATVFYRADGSSDGIALNDRSTGPDLAVIRRIPRRICIVAGTSRKDSLDGALAAGLVTDLFVDESLARLLAA